MLAHAMNVEGMKLMQTMTTTAILIMKVILTTIETPHAENKP